MVMIPGAWEPRLRSAAVPPPVALAPSPPVAAPGDSAPAEARRAELPAWMKVSIFAGTLLAATWIAMALFF